MAGSKPGGRAWEAEARRLWNSGVGSASELAHRFGVSKSVIVGLAHRQGWAVRNPGRVGARPEDETPQRTTEDRIVALHARMDAVVAECRGVPRLKLPVAGEKRPATDFRPGR